LRLFTFRVPTDTLWVTVGDRFLQRPAYLAFRSGPRATPGARGRTGARNRLSRGRSHSWWQKKPRRCYSAAVAWTGGPLVKLASELRSRRCV